MESCSTLLSSIPENNTAFLSLLNAVLSDAINQSNPYDFDFLRHFFNDHYGQLVDFRSYLLPGPLMKLLVNKYKEFRRLTELHFDLMSNINNISNLLGEENNGTLSLIVSTLKSFEPNEFDSVKVAVEFVDLFAHTMNVNDIAFRHIQICKLLNLVEVNLDSEKAFLNKLDVILPAVAAMNDDKVKKTFLAMLKSKMDLIKLCRSHLKAYLVGIMNAEEYLKSRKFYSLNVELARQALRFEVIELQVIASQMMVKMMEFYEDKEELKNIFVVDVFMSDQFSTRRASLYIFKSLVGTFSIKFLTEEGIFEHFVKFLKDVPQIADKFVTLVPSVFNLLPPNTPYRREIENLVQNFKTKDPILSKEFEKLKVWLNINKNNKEVAELETNIQKELEKIKKETKSSKSNKLILKFPLRKIEDKFIPRTLKQPLIPKIKLKMSNISENRHSSRNAAVK